MLVMMLLKKGPQFPEGWQRHGFFHLVWPVGALLIKIEINNKWVFQSPRMHASILSYLRASLLSLSLSLSISLSLTHTHTPMLLNVGLEETLAINYYWWSWRRKQIDRLHLESKTSSCAGLWTLSYMPSIYGNNIPTGKPGPLDGRAPGLVPRLSIA